MDKEKVDLLIGIGAFRIGYATIEGDKVRTFVHKVKVIDGYDIDMPENETDKIALTPEGYVYEGDGVNDTDEAGYLMFGSPEVVEVENQLTPAWVEKHKGELFVDFYDFPPDELVRPERFVGGFDGMYVDLSGDDVRGWHYRAREQ